MTDTDGTAKATTELPSALSALLRAAAAAGRGLDRNRYTPFAGVWHDPGPGANSAGHDNWRCNVCLAGAVMSGSLQARREFFLRPEDYPPETAERLIAIEYARDGDLIGACIRLGCELTAAAVGRLSAIDGASYKQFTSWHEFDRFLSEIERVAGELETIGF